MYHVSLVCPCSAPRTRKTGLNVSHHAYLRKIQSSHHSLLAIQHTFCIYGPVRPPPATREAPAVQVKGLPQTPVSRVRHSSTIFLWNHTPSATLNGDEIIETVQTRSTHTSNSEYTAHTESFFILRILAAPADEVLPVRAVSAL